MKYKMGDKVKIVDKRTYYMNGVGHMDKYLGKTMTIRCCSHGVYCMYEDDGEWSWHDEMIECKVEESKDITNSELWKLVEDGKVKDGDEFTHTQFGQLYVFKNGTFYCESNDKKFFFNSNDKWEIVPKPKMTREQVREKFGVEVVD